MRSNFSPRRTSRLQTAPATAILNTDCCYPNHKVTQNRGVRIIPLSPPQPLRVMSFNPSPWQTFEFELFSCDGYTFLIGHMTHLTFADLGPQGCPLTTGSQRMVPVINLLSHWVAVTVAHNHVVTLISDGHECVYRKYVDSYDSRSRLSLGNQILDYSSCLPLAVLLSSCHLHKPTSSYQYSQSLTRLLVRTVHRTSTELNQQGSHSQWYLPQLRYNLLHLSQCIMSEIHYYRSLVTCSFKLETWHSFHFQLELLNFRKDMSLPLALSFRNSKTLNS